MYPQKALGTNTATAFNRRLLALNYFCALVMGRDGRMSRNNHTTSEKMKMIHNSRHDTSYAANDSPVYTLNYFISHQGDHSQLCSLAAHLLNQLSWAPSPPPLPPSRTLPSLTFAEVIWDARYTTLQPEHQYLTHKYHFKYTSSARLAQAKATGPVL